MKIKLLVLSAALSCTFANMAFAMTKVEYKTQKDAITAEYKVNSDKCDSFKANAKDICMSEAKGVRKIALAELESAYAPTARNAEKMRLAKGDAAYDTAKEKCDDIAGNAKNICQKDAKAAHVKAVEEARVVRVKADTGQVNKEVRNMATKEENEANYKADAARCDSLAGAAKDTCVGQAKMKFGMK